MKLYNMKFSRQYKYLYCDKKLTEKLADIVSIDLDYDIEYDKERVVWTLHKDNAGAFRVTHKPNAMIFSYALSRTLMQRVYNLVDIDGNKLLFLSTNKDEE